MSRAAAPFSPRVVLALIAVGAAAFLLFLYALGAGWTGGDRAMGSGHAASKGLNGYAALVELLDRRGHDVSVSRTPGRLDEEALLVLTPPHYTDGEELAELIEERRWQGPTIVVLPKWFGFEPAMAGIEDAPRGWVALGDAESPEWLGEVEDVYQAKLAIARRGSWKGLGLTGALPDPKSGQALSLASVETDEWTSVLPLVTDAKGDVLAGYFNDDGVYPALDEASGYSPGDSTDEALWPVVIVAEPDLLNNYGLADRGNAELADALVAATLDGYDLPIVFDLTLPGLGRNENLLTLAFEPPFLAATLVLLLAALAVGWRAFARFGERSGPQSPADFGIAAVAGAEALGTAQRAVKQVTLAAEVTIIPWRWCARRAAAPISRAGPLRAPQCCWPTPRAPAPRSKAATTCYPTTSRRSPPRRCAIACCCRPPPRSTGAESRTSSTD